MGRYASAVLCFTPDTCVLPKEGKGSHAMPSDLTSPLSADSTSSLSLCLHNTPTSSSWGALLGLLVHPAPDGNFHLQWKLRGT